MLTWDALVQQWWLQVAAGLAVFIVTAGIVAIFSNRVRERFWVPVGRSLWLPFTVRLTTTRRQREVDAQVAGLAADRELAERRFKEVCDLLGVRPLLPDSTIVVERIEGLQIAAVAAREHAESQIAATQEVAKKQIRDEQIINEGQLALQRRSGQQEGYAQAMTEVGEQRAIPLSKPVWRVEKDEHPDQYTLRNVQPDALATDVRIEPVLGMFSFDSPNQWPGGPFRSQTFVGDRMGAGRTLEVDFKVHYRNAIGDWNVGQAVLAREPRRVIVR